MRPLLAPKAQANHATKKVRLPAKEGRSCRATVLPAYRLKESPRGQYTRLAGSINRLEIVSSVSCSPYLTFNRLVETNSMRAQGQNTYRLSFTTGGLALHVAQELAQLKSDDLSWEEVRRKALESNSGKLRTLPSRKRQIRESAFRLMTLSREELAAFREGTDQDQQFLLWVAICRTYPLIASFARNVVHDHFLAMRDEITHQDFDYFFEKQSLEHPELDEITEMTRKKLRQELFRIMREASLLNQQNRFLTCILSPLVETAIMSTNPPDLQFFPTSQRS